MGCLNACICAGNCLTCNDYQKEQYVGEAEDLYDEMYERNEPDYQQEYDKYCSQQFEQYVNDNINP